MINISKKQANILFVVLIIVVFAFIIFAIYYMISNREAFMENPFMYGAKKMNLKECYCNCYNDYDTQPTSLYFNHTFLSQKGG